MAEIIAKVPTEFGEEFLTWFQVRTESTWSTYPTPSLERFAARRMLGCDWQPDTRWLDGMNEEQIATVERQWNLQFPPDYHLFLARLHSVDRPMRCVWGKQSPHDVPTLHDAPSFYNWLNEHAVIQDRLDALVEGLQFDVENNGLWRSGWGPKPTAALTRAERVQELVSAAPRLIPVFSHHYLLAEPPHQGNPIFSIVQSDVIVIAADLRSYFLSEFAELLGIARADARKESEDRVQANFAGYLAIPFWGGLCAG